MGYTPARPSLLLMKLVYSLLIRKGENERKFILAFEYSNNVGVKTKELVKANKIGKIKEMDLTQTN